MGRFLDQLHLPTLALVLGLGLGLPWLWSRAAGDPGTGPGEATSPEAGEGPRGLRPIPADQVCTLDAGYLCDPLEEDGEFQVLRYPRDTERITIYIPPAPDTDPVRDRELRQAVTQGLMAWSGKPFQIRVQRGAVPRNPDIRIRWHRTLPDGALGRTSTRFTRTGDQLRYEVVALELALHDPWVPDRPLTPEAVRLVAAHELGHALGLPHSRDPRDLMYPSNTAQGLTSQDFRTLNALYALPNGSVIRP